MEASTSDEMLDKLCGRFVVRPSTQPSPPTPWDRRTSRQVRIKDKGKDKDVVIDTIEHYTCENGTLTGVTVRGPNGLVTSTYEEMLELLGIAPERPLSAGSKLSAKAEQQLSPVTSQVSQEREPPTVEPEFTVSQDGKLVANRATEEPCFRWDSKPAAALPPVTSSSHRAQGPVLALTDGTGSAPFPKDDEDREDPARDANSGREYDLRAKEFVRKHPWLWGNEDEQEEDGAERNPDVEEMKLIWHAEHTKAVYPELYAAALDPQKYREYMEKNDYEMPASSEEEGEPVAADSPRCQFIKSDGEQCGSPALKKKTSVPLPFQDHRRPQAQERQEHGGWRREDVRAGASRA